MPMIDKFPTDRPAIDSPAVLVASREVLEIEAAFVPGADARATPTALLRFTTTTGREVYRFTPMGLVLAVQDLNDLLASRGGMVAVLREALNHDTAPAAAPAFEGAER